MWMIVFMRLTYFCKSAIKFFLHIANETPLSKAFYQWKLGPCEAKKRPEVCRAGISLSQGGKRIGKHRNCDDVSVLAIDIQHLRQLTLLSCPFMLQLGFTAVAMPLASKSDLIVDVNQRHSYWYTKIDTCWDPVGYSISHGCSFNHSSFQSSLVFNAAQTPRCLSFADASSQKEDLYPIVADMPQLPTFKPVYCIWYLHVHSKQPNDMQREQEPSSSIPSQKTYQDLGDNRTLSVFSRGVVYIHV